MRTKQVLIVVLMFSAIVAFSQTTQDRAKKMQIGLTAMVTDPQLDILVPLYFNWGGNESISIAPAIGFQSVEDIGSDISLGVVIRVHKRYGSISQFAGIGIGASKYESDAESVFPGVDEPQTDIFVNPHLGLEKYFDNNFCLGVSAQVSIVKPDEHSYRLGYPDKLLINTATSLYVTLFY